MHARARAPAAVGPHLRGAPATTARRQRRLSRMLQGGLRRGSRAAWWSRLSAPNPGQRFKCGVGSRFVLHVACVEPNLQGNPRTGPQFTMTRRFWKASSRRLEFSGPNSVDALRRGAAGSAVAMLPVMCARRAPRDRFRYPRQQPLAARLTRILCASLGASLPACAGWARRSCS